MTEASKLIKVINEIAPRMNNNTQDSVDREVADLIYARKELFLMAHSHF